MTVRPRGRRWFAGEQARHARRAPARRPAGPRFGAVGLVAAVALSFGAGAGTGSVLRPVPTGFDTASAQGSAIAQDGAGAQDGPDEQVGDAPSGPAAESDGVPVPMAEAADPVGGLLERTSDRYGLRTPPPVPAVPASPVPLSPTLVDEDGMTLADRAAGLLSTEVPEAASGELVIVPGSAAAPDDDRDVRRIRVEVEDGLDVDGERFAAAVMEILNDPRGWGADGSVSFARTDGDADVRVVLASPRLVDELCAPLTTRGTLSCGTKGHAVLNMLRWVEGTPEFEDLTTYRQYLVNHEVGHLLGKQHEQCPGPGETAPLMQQQTIGVAPCVPNGWPFPDAA